MLEQPQSLCFLELPLPLHRAPYSMSCSPWKEPASFSVSSTGDPSFLYNAVRQGSVTHLEGKFWPPGISRVTPWTAESRQQTQKMILACQQGNHGLCRVLNSFFSKGVMFLAQTPYNKRQINKAKHAHLLDKGFSVIQKLSYGTEDPRRRLTHSSILRWWRIGQHRVWLGKGERVGNLMAIN